MKRQQTVILKQQEKERRKQHLMMIRALESQRKAEVCVVVIYLDPKVVLSIGPSPLSPSAVVFLIFEIASISNA